MRRAYRPAAIPVVVVDPTAGVDLRDVSAVCRRLGMSPAALKIALEWPADGRWCDALGAAGLIDIRNSMPRPASRIGALVRGRAPPLTDAGRRLLAVLREMEGP